MIDPKDADDPQVAALMQASGHVRDDVLLILMELNRAGWTVRPTPGASHE